MVFLCNPNNPTGKITSGESVRRLLKKCEETGALLVVDESFGEFTENYRDYSMEMCIRDRLEVGDCFADIVGPLGKPTHMEGLKKVCVVGGGTGNALAYPDVYKRQVL